MLPRARLLNFGRHFSRLPGRPMQSGATLSTLTRTSSHRPRLTLIGGSTIAVLMWLVPSTAACADGEKEGQDKEESGDDKLKNKNPTGSDPFDAFIKTTAMPFLNRLGFGGIMGFCSGVAIKRIGEAMIYVCGVSFIGIQVAQYKGYISVDWFHVRDEAIALVDVDGDGQITSADLQAYWAAFKKIMTQAVPSSAGFGAGFLLGIYYA